MAIDGCLRTSNAGCSFRERLCYRYTDSFETGTIITAFRKSRCRDLSELEEHPIL